RTFLRVEKSLIDKITFRYPADSGFVLQKESSRWLANGLTADSARVETYLEKLRSKELSGFVNDSKPSADPDIVLDIQGPAYQQSVQAWNGGDGEWILTSSFQPGVYFNDDGFADELFPGHPWFTKPE